MANARRRNFFLDKLRMDRELLTEEESINEGVVNDFSRILAKLREWRPSISGLQFDSLSSVESEALETSFLEEEVLAALSSLSGDKALGPDGFTIAFQQCCWDFVKREVMSSFKEFHEFGSFQKSLNATFLVLVPKKGGAKDLKDFRSISLVGELYKLLAKVLANRLKKVVDNLMSDFQNAFVVGKQILDVVSLIPNFFFF